MSDVQAQTKEMNEKFDMFFKLYAALMSALNKLPIAPALLDKVRYDMDSGFLWIKECLAMTQIQIQQVQDSQNESKINPELNNQEQSAPQQETIQ